MIRYFMTLLLLLPVLAQAASPAFISAVDCSLSSTASLDCPPPSGGGYGTLDLALITWADDVDHTTKVINVPSGWTEITQGSTAGAWGARDQRYAIQYRVRTADGTPSNTVWTYDGGSTSGSARVSTSAWSGMHTGAVWDVAFVDGSHRAEQLDAFTSGVYSGGTPAAIATVTTDTTVVIMEFIGTGTPQTAGAPSGYTIRSNNQNTNRAHVVVSKAVAAIGTESPGAWTHSGFADTVDLMDFTLAIRAVPIREIRRRRK